MPRQPRNDTKQVAALKARLAEVEETLDAIRTGAVDALVVHGEDGEQIFTLKGADQVYRVLVEAMNEGAVTVDSDGIILYCNSRLATMVKAPLEKVIGVPLATFITLRERTRLREFLRQAHGRSSTTETALVNSDGDEVAVHLSTNPLPSDDVQAICLVITDITQRKEAERAQRELSRSVIEAQERERQRVARELHDGVNQLLSSTKHRLHDIESRLNGVPQPVRRNVVQVRRLLERTIGEVRAISRNLRPSELDDLGLLAAMRSLGDEFEERTRIKFEFSGEAPRRALTPQLELTVYRIVQEALANVEKHASATRVVARFKSADARVELSIRDNGKGFVPGTVAGAHWGLINMRERASHVNGTLAVHSQPGRGTTIQLQVPV